MLLHLALRDHAAATQQLELAQWAWRVYCLQESANCTAADPPPIDPQVGLPARGKTFLCNKVMCYLNWWAAMSWGRRDLGACGVACAPLCCCCCRLNLARAKWPACAVLSSHRLGHPTKHFNVGQYRRRVKGAEHQASNQAEYQLANCLTSWVRALVFSSP